MSSRKRKSTKNVIKFPTNERNRLKKFLLDCFQRNDHPTLICRDIYETFDDPGKELAECILNEPDLTVMNIATSTLIHALTSDEIPDFAFELYIDGAIPILQAALSDPKVPDSKKITAGSICSLAQPENNIQDLMLSNLKDPDALKNAATQQLSALLKPDPFSLMTIFSSIHLLDDENPSRLQIIDNYNEIKFCYMSICQVAPNCPEGAAAALCSIIACTLPHPDIPASDALAALDTLRDLNSSVVTWFLRELAALPAAGQIGFKAGAYAAAMEREGILPHFDPGFTFKKGQISQIDGDGSFSISLEIHKKGSKRKTDCLALLINDKIGLKDIWFVSDEGSQLMKQFHQQPSSAAFYDCSLEFALRMVAWALEIHKQANAPILGEFLISRIYLGGDPIQPQSFEPDLSAYHLRESTFQMELVALSTLLMDEPTYNTFLFFSNHSYNFIKEYAPKRGRACLSKKKLDLYCEQVLPHEIEILLPRMAQNLQLEAMAGRVDKKINQIAAHTWYALKNQLIPYTQIPYIMEMVQDSIPMTIENVRDGFSNQNEANQAYMNDNHTGLLDDVDMLDFIKEMMDDWDNNDNEFPPFSPLK